MSDIITIALFSAISALVIAVLIVWLCSTIQELRKQNIELRNAHQVYVWNKEVIGEYKKKVEECE